MSIYQPQTASDLIFNLQKSAPDFNIYLMGPDKYRVLIVDDDLMTRDLVISILSWEGHKCESAMDGVEALEKAGAADFDAVITDIVMPRMDGITLTRELSKKFHGLPIMVMTGFTEEHSDEEALDAGASEFINKPFPVTELLARFHKMVRDHKIALQIKSRRKDIERISSEMIAGLQKDSLEKIEVLKREIEDLKKRMHTS